MKVEGVKMDKKLNVIDEERASECHREASAVVEEEGGGGEAVSRMQCCQVQMEGGKREKGTTEWVVGCVQ